MSDREKSHDTGLTASSLASVIIPCWNLRDFTRFCLQSLFQHTRSPWELIVIDNGSTDGTAAYLAEIRDTSPVPVKVITNRENRGFPAAINQGLQAAKGDYLVLLNNDTVVTEGWLDRLIALTAKKRKAIEPPVGLAGPMSNYASPPQLVERVPYLTIEDMHDFAKEWAGTHRGTELTAVKLSGFCLLMTRAVYEAVGGLDEQFGLGTCDDDDLAMRARKAGFGLAVAQEAFVHHYGNRTFTALGTDVAALLDENAARFAAKWGQPLPGQRVGLRSGGGISREDGGGSKNTKRGGDTGRPSDSTRKARVSLTMIVRNEEKNLQRCLESVRGFFDEIVVVDTGSQDRTKEIAASFGARVFDFAWIDDFAAARNAALEHATGDYAFWLDADDVIEPSERGKLKALLDTLRSDKKQAYVLRCFSTTDSGGQIAVDHPRLFPLLPSIRWTRRIHEVIDPALLQAGIPMAWTDIVIQHLGYTDPAEHERKRQRNLVLLQRDLAERPDDPFIYYYLGTLAFERERWQEALGYFILSLAKWGTTQSIACKLLAMIAWTNELLQRNQESLRVADEGLTHFPTDGELLFRKAIALRFLHRPTEAEACFMLAAARN